MKKLFSGIIILFGFAAPLFFIPRVEPCERYDPAADVGYLEFIEYKPKPAEFVDVKQLLAESEAPPDITKEEPAPDTKEAPPSDGSEPKYPAPYALTPEERDLVERVVMHEAGYCPDYRLLLLTAQCFRNDCELNGWRPAETFSRCGYAAMSRANDRSREAVADVFDRGVKCVDEPIFCYYNRNLVYSPDHERHNLAIDIDGNRFFY